MSARRTITLISGMCLIIKKPPGRPIAPAFLRNAWQHNCHGWGYFLRTPAGMRVERGLHLQELLARNAQWPASAEVFIHLRKATYGAVSLDMAHPHVVRPGLLLMHNGSIAHLAPEDPDRSDTAELAAALRDLLEGLDPDQTASVIRSAGFARLIAPLIDGSMIVLLDHRGGLTLGRNWHALDAADWDDSMAGIEVSNLHTWRQPAVA